MSRLLRPVRRAFTRLELRLLDVDLRKTASEYDDAICLGQPRIAAALANHHASLRHQEVLLRVRLAQLSANT